MTCSLREPFVPLATNVSLYEQDVTRSLVEHFGQQVISDLQAPFLDKLFSLFPMV